MSFDFSVATFPMPNTTDDITSVRALGKLVGRSHAAVQRWLDHPDWTFGSPPWPRSTLTPIVEWANDFLQDRSGRPPVRETDPRVPQYVYRRGWPRVSVDVDSDAYVASLLALAEPVVLPIERDVTGGTRTLTPGEQRGLALCLIELKRHVLAVADDSAEFAHRDPEDLRERLRAMVHVVMEIHRDHVESFFGRAAIGARPRWLQWQRDNSYSVEPDGSVWLRDPDPDDECEPEPTLRDYLAAYDAKANPKPPARAPKASAAK